MPIAIYFRLPVDPDRDGVPDYYEKVRRPIDFETIMERLRERKYTSLDKWKEDVHQIYKNAILYHTETSMVTAMAKEVVDFGKRKFDSIPKTEWEMWAYRVAKTHRKLNAILACCPDSSAPKARTKISLKLKVK